MHPLVGLLVTFVAVSSFANAEYIPPGPKWRCPDQSTRHSVTRSLFPCRCDQGTDAGLYVSCENSNLATLSVGLGQVAALNAPVESLHISGCNIARLQEGLFKNLHIRLLKITDTPIRTIDNGTFQGLEDGLEELQIIKSDLKYFPSLALQPLKNLSLLRLEDHSIPNLDGSAFESAAFAGKLLRLHIANGRIKSLSNDALAPLKRLRTLDLHGNNLTEFVKNPFRGLRDVEALDVSHNNLSRLDASQLSDLPKLAFCNASHNALTELARGAFARNTLLRYLNVAHNKLRRLDSNSFRGMRLIRRLYLSDNNIADVGRGTFGGISRIGTIDLARNQLTKIDYQMFQQLQYCEEIDVSENKVTLVEKVAFKDLYLVKINLSRNAIEKVEPGAFENCANMTILDMTYNRISALPRTAFDATTYATELRLSFNNFTDLSQVPLHNMTGLKILNVSYNNLERVPKNTFPKLYELHTVDLSHNRIDEIWNGVFQTLFSLRYLNLSHNNIGELRSSALGAVPTVLEIDMSYNNLTEVGRGSFARLSSLRFLNLSHNSLDKVFQLPTSLSHLDMSYNVFSNLGGGDESPWPSMNALLSLDLSHNLLTTSGLPRGSFGNLLTLQTLDLSSNMLDSPPRDALVDLSALQHLGMRNNSVKSLERGAFGRLPVVFDLDLSYNGLKNLSLKAFDGMLQLLHLKLSNNDISSVAPGVLFGLVSLRSLDLSNNSIERLDNKTHGMLDDCLSLEMVNLSYNKISFVTRKTFPSSPYIPYRLHTVDLSHNMMPVLTYDLTFGTGKMETLNVSHNIINEIRRNVIGNLSSVRELDLSYNELDTLGDASLKLPPRLRILRIANNRLKSLPTKLFTEIRPPLSILDVRNNEIPSVDISFLPMLMNHSVLHFTGNPLKCTCEVRPLRHWLGVQPKVLEEWETVRCSEPELLENMTLIEVREERLTCPKDMPASMQLRFDISPDLKFREMKRIKEGLAVSWFVTTNEDVGEFLLVIREVKTGKELLSENVAFNQRNYIVDAASVDEALSKTASAELCVLAKDSLGDFRRWRASQCRTLPASFKSAGIVVRSSLAVCLSVLVLALCVVSGYGQF